MARYHFPLPIRLGPARFAALFVDGIKKSHDVIGRVAQFAQDTPQHCPRATTSTGAVNDDTFALLKAADDGQGDDSNGPLFLLWILGHRLLDQVAKLHCYEPCQGRRIVEWSITAKTDDVSEPNLVESLPGRVSWRQDHSGEGRGSRPRPIELLRNSKAREFEDLRWKRIKGIRGCFIRWHSFLYVKNSTL